MKLETVSLLPPLPPGWTSLPPVLTFGQVEQLCSFWNLGTRHYVEGLRDCGVLVSVTAFPKGQRARYAATRMPDRLRKRHPNAVPVVELYPAS